MRKIIFIFLSMTAGLLGYAVLAHAEKSQKRTGIAGGAATVDSASGLAFSLSIPNLTQEQLQDFSFGNRLFNTNWTIAPGSVASFDGLGPTFNRVSCSSCHFKDGRGKPPANEKDLMESMLVRISLPGSDPHGGPLPHPIYGDQIQDRSIPGVPAEGYVTISYEEIKGNYADGTPYTLTRPQYKFNNLSFGPLGDNILFSPRVASPVFGLGLLEAVPEDTILQHADPDDENGDGISGKPNYVWDVSEKKKRLGRFGWKANQPSLLQQDTAALAGDMGLSSPVFQEQNCPHAQKECSAAANGGSPELSQEFLKRLEAYSQTIAVPAARNVQDPLVKQGEAIFKEAGCGGCHLPHMKTGKSPIAQLSEQEIEPFTDLLLHDMGKELADGRPDFEATGQEWRTPPLWGIGLTETVNGHTRFLHDGRARNLEEAILWHGGEASKAKEAFKSLSKTDRKALITFLESL